MICQIIEENCIACGLCQVIAPTIFDYSDNGIVLFANMPGKKYLTIPKSLEQVCQQAIVRCPARALEIKRT